MTVSPLIPCGGLATDPNPLLSAARGAMRVCRDVSIERPGVATPRPSFTYVNTKAVTRRPRSMHVWGDTPFVASADDAFNVFRVETAANVYTSAEPLDRTLSWSQFCEMRDSLYWTTKAGPYKVTSEADSAESAAGMHEAPSGLPSVVTTGTPVVLPTNNAAAWRWCFKKTDANGVETRSAPSPWSLMTNNSGSTQDMSWVVPLPGYVAANDQIELYRTVAVTPYTSTPSDVMYLAVKYVVTSSDVTNGYATLTDRTAETALGAELYTNPTREGLLKANGRPPASVALASWSDCAWYGYIRGPYTTSFDIVTVSGATATDGLTGLQRLARAGCVVTSGSNTITGLASTTSIKIGQLCTDGGIPGATSGTIPVPARVTGKTATTVTLDSNATASSAAITLYFHDGVVLDDGVDTFTFWAGVTEIIDPLYPVFAVTAGNRERSTARSLAYVITRVSDSAFAYAVEDPYYRAGPLGEYTQATVVVRSSALDRATAPSITFVADTTSSPPAIQFTADTSGNVLVDRDDLPHGIAYSKPFEPEHVPELNWFPVGNEDDPIYALAPLAGSLLVFKRDGIFRITGSAPDGWRVDQIEAHIDIARGERVDVFAGEAWCWAVGGVYRVNDGGARNISEGLIGRTLGPLAPTASTYTDSFVRCFPERNTVIVVPASGNTSTTAYAFNINTGAWSSWQPGGGGLRCAAYQKSLRRLYIARGGDRFEIRRSRNVGDTASEFGHDRVFTGLTWSYTADTTTVVITDAQRGEWDPAINDWVACTIGGVVYYRRITDAQDTGSDYTLTIESAWPAGAQSSRTAYEGITSVMQWQAFTVGTPAVSMLASKLHLMVNREAANKTLGGDSYRWLLGASTNLVNDAVTAEVTGTRVQRPTQHLVATVPTEAARCDHLYPYVATADLGIEWLMDGVCVEYEGVAPRGVR
jgi:hypothetical protein